MRVKHIVYCICQKLPDKKFRRNGTRKRVLFLFHRKERRQKLVKSMDYDGRKWKKKREKIKRLDGYKDVIAGWYGRTEPAQMVHHIYPAEQFPEYAWEDWNLISVSYSTHKKLENHMTGGLTEMGKQLMRSTIPGVDWRKKRKVSPLVL